MFRDFIQNYSGIHDWKILLRPILNFLFTLVSKLPRLKNLNAESFKELIEKGNVVVDTRSYLAFGAQHISGSWSLDINGNLPTFAGWVLPIDKDLLVVSDSFKEAEKTNVWLRRVGQDRVMGYLDGGMADWVIKGYKTNHITQISAEDLHEMVSGSESCCRFARKIF